MKRIISFVFSVILCIPFYAQTDEPVVMTVNGYDVGKSEFEYFLNKNKTETTVSKKIIRHYADLYLNFKLKVQAAIDEGLDKAPSFLEEYRMYRDMQAESYLVDTLYLEETARKTYQRSLDEVGPDGLASISIISLTPKDDTREAFMEQGELIDEIYGMLEAGQPFPEVARKFSTDNLAASGGVAGWVSRSQVPEDVADIVFSLAPGQYSKPFVSDGVFFVIKVDDRRQIGSYEENRADIYQWMLQNEYYSEAKRRRANEYAERLGWEVRGDEAVAHLDSVLEEVEPDFGNLSREYHDGLLLFEISNREVWEKAAGDKSGQEEYYNSNVKKYKFKEPCFKGMVFFCADEDVFHNVENAVKGLDLSEWIDTIVKFNREKIVVRVMRGTSETGIFRKGENAYVDKIVFGQGDFEPMKNFPYTNVIGKTIKAPESMADVSTQVLEDYQTYLENNWVSRLRKKYSYSVNKKVLNDIHCE